MKISKRKLIELLKEFKEEFSGNNFDFDLNLGVGDFIPPPPSPRSNGGGGQNYPMILLSSLRRESKFFEDYVPDPSESEQFRQYRLKMARAELGSHLPGSEGFPQSRVTVEVGGEDKVLFNFGFRRFGVELDGTPIADYGIAQIVPIPCASLKMVENIFKKVEKFCEVAENKNEEQLNKEYEKSIKEYKDQIVASGFEQEDLKSLGLDDRFSLGTQDFWERYTR